MKNSITKIMIATLILLSTSIYAQIKNTKTETVRVYGNCGMCETTIEKAGKIKGIAEVDWDQDTQMATLTYDTTKTNQDEILKKIALAGYDSDVFLAPTEAYDKLPGCCQYDRVAKVAMNEATVEANNNHLNHSDMATEEVGSKNQLQAVFESYFLVKEALVSSDVVATAASAKALVIAIDGVKMNQLDTDVHMVWMKVVQTMKDRASQIAGSKDIKAQRAQFSTLSDNMYALMKVSKYDVPVYYQHCPMYNDGKGANWLSKENTIKNPYYGSKMLTCGKTIATIKK